MQVTPGLHFGGLERVVLNICRYIDREQFDISVCCLNLRGALADELEPMGIKIHVCSQGNRRRRYLRSLELLKVFRVYRPDVIHTHNTNAFLDGLLAARLVGVPVVVHTDHCKNYFQEKRRYMLGERVASFFTDKIVAVSEDTKRNLIYRQRIKAERIEVIYNGIPDLSRLNFAGREAVRSKLGLKSNEWIVGSIGRLEDQKGYDLFIKTAALVERKLGNVRFFIIGDGSNRQRLEELIRRHELEGKVTLLGWRVDAVRFLSLFDVFVMTSKDFEGLPVVLLEAMASRKPIVSTAVGGVPEVVQDGQNGFIIPSRDPQAFAEVICRLLTDKKMRQQFGQNSYQKYLSHYRSEVMVNRYEKLYKILLEQRDFHLKPLKSIT